MRKHKDYKGYVGLYEAEKDFFMLVLSSAVRAVLGRRGASVFESHLSNLLGRNPYEVAYENPHLLYLAIRRFYGKGAERILYLIASHLREREYIALEPNDFVELLKMDEAWARDMLLSSLRPGLDSG